MNNIAVNLLDTGKAVDAKPYFESALSEARIAEDRYLEAVCLHNLGESAVQMNELENADGYLVDSVEIFRAIGNRPLFARTLLLQGEIAALKNLHGNAMVLSRSALEEFRDIEDSEGIASAIEVLACSHLQTDGDPAVFLTITSAAAELRHNIKLRIAPARSELLGQLTKKARKSLGAARSAEAVEQGKTIGLKKAIEFALNIKSLA